MTDYFHSTTFKCYLTMMPSDSTHSIINHSSANAKVIQVVGLIVMLILVIGS